MSNDGGVSSCWCDSTVSFGVEEENEKGADTDGALCVLIVSNVAVMMKGQGSFTIEAAIIMPILLFIILATICIAVDLYQETMELVAKIYCKEQFDLITAMYHIDSIKNLISEWGN